MRAKGRHPAEFINAAEAAGTASVPNVVAPLSGILAQHDGREEPFPDLTCINGDAGRARSREGPRLLPKHGPSYAGSLTAVSRNRTGCRGKSRPVSSPDTPPTGSQVPGSGCAASGHLTRRPPTRDNGHGTGPAPFWGACGVKSLSTPSIAIREGRGVSVNRRRVAIAAVAVSAVIAITAATALPSLTPASRAVAAPQPQPPLSVQPSTKSAGTSATESDPTIRRFTGRVGPDLSRRARRRRRARAAGPRICRACSPAPSRSPTASASTTASTWSSSATPDGSLGQLLYAGIDRVARADVELMKWTDGKQSSGSTPTASAAMAARRMRMPVQGRVTSRLRRALPPDPRL